MSQYDFGLGMLDCEQEKLAHFAGVPGLVGVEQNDQAQVAAFFYYGSHVGIGDVEVLGVGMKFDFFCAELRYSLQLCECGFLVGWVHGDYGIEGVSRCCGGSEYSIILFAGLFRLALAGDYDEGALAYAGGLVEFAEGICTDWLCWH